MAGTKFVVFYPNDQAILIGSVYKITLMFAMIKTLYKFPHKKNCLAPSLSVTKSIFTRQVLHCANKNKIRLRKNLIF